MATSLSIGWETSVDFVRFDTDGGRWGDEVYQEERVGREGVILEMCPPVRFLSARIKETKVVSGSEKEKEGVEAEVLEGWKFHEEERRREFMKLVRFEVSNVEERTTP